MEKKKITKIVLIVLSIALVISALVSSTYALFSSDSYGAQANDYTTGMLSIEAVSKSDTISLTNALPMTDEEGKETTPYVFSVKNIGNLDYQFDIELLSTGDVSNTFPASIIKLQIDDGDVTTLAEIGGKIKEDVVLLAGESLDVSIRIWLSKEGTTNDHLGMSFNSKIVTNGQAIYTSSNNEYKSTFVDYLTSLYMNANPAQATVANNGINYYYAPSVNMMNDGMGSNHTWEDGVNAGNIRYYGGNPNNYIDIGDRDASGNVIPWRIIGVFKSVKLADGTTDTLVKIKRDEPLNEQLSWNSNGTNDWSNSSLMTYLNEGEYYTGLTQEVKNKIASVEWNLGGLESVELYANDVYAKEFLGNKCAECSYETVWKGKIALSSVSDYGYASDLNRCGTMIKNYANPNYCITCCLSWYWTTFGYLSLNPFLGDNNSVFGFVQPPDQMNYNSVTSERSLEPALYLKSSLLYDSGDGSEEKPYKLKVEKETFVDYLTNLYMNANPAHATVANNGINYYYAPSVNMMNDGMGSNHTWEDGVNVGNIRYYGENPNNYIDIGDRDDSGNVIPWRIIGVFKNMKLADGSTDTLVKVIRDVSLSNSMSWGSSDWSNTTIKTYLNDEEYYTVLSQSVKDKIAKVEWNLGGSSNSNVYSNDIYFHERGEEKCTTCTYDTIWEGNIALMYPSDFGYATDLTSCSNTLRYYESDQVNCLGKNWLFENSFQSLLTPDLSSNYAWRVWSNGRVSSFDGPSTLNIRPTLYLKSILFYDSGDGSSVESAYVVK